MEEKTKTFIQTLDKCVKEYRKQCNETYDEVDAAHFYDKKLKKFIKDNMTYIDQLSQIVTFKPSHFMAFIKHYLFEDKD